MDPLSLALISFTALKKGIALGKDLGSMGKDLNKVFKFIDGTKAAHKSGNKNDPLSELTAYYKAQDMEKAIEQMVWEARGSAGVSMLKRLRAQSAERDRDSRYESMARKNKILNVLSILLGVSITVGGGALLLWAAIEFKP